LIKNLTHLIQDSCQEPLTVTQLLSRLIRRWFY